MPTEAVRRIIVTLLSTAAIEVRIESWTTEAVVVILALAVVIVVVSTKRHRIAALE